MSKVLTFTANIQLPANTPAGLRTIPTQLDSEYDRATGFATYTNSDGGIPGFQIGLRDDTQLYASLTNSKFFEAGIDCPKSSRLTPTNIPCTGRQLNILLNLPAQLTTALNVDVVFQLEGAPNGR